MRKTAVVTGSSRGIGRKIAFMLAKNNYNIVLAAKTTTESHDKQLPSTIYYVEQEIRRMYPETKILALKTNVQQEESVINLRDHIAAQFGSVDVLINNASALSFGPVAKMGMKKFDLVNSVNSRGSYMLSHYLLPLMEQTSNTSHIIMHSPPIDLKQVGKYTGYMISKYGMTLTALGIAQEYNNRNIVANTIWPATLIKSYATINNNLGNEGMWRKPEIICDAIEWMLREPPTFTGNMLIDEDYLKTKGVTDFKQYRCVHNIEPPKLYKSLNL
jgi:citronellol/citronellal dehydrogenase